MSIVIRATDDMLCMASWIDVMVNPVNCKGIMGKGLALAFKEYCPEQYEAYREMCMNEELTIGKIHIYYHKKDNVTIINAPTKKHWIDSSNLNDVELTISKIRDYLLEHPFYTVAMPMLGTGNGKLEHQNVLDLFYKYLDPLPNLIFLCIRVENVPVVPKYLVIGGSREYTDYDKVEIGIWDAFISFNLEYKDFTAIVSGGARGVDKIACGSGLPEDLDPNIANCHKVKPIVIRADWERYGKSAGYIRNKLMLEVGTHFVLYIGKVSRGTRAMKELVERHNNQFLETYFGKPIEDIPPTKRLKELYVHDISSMSL